MLATIRSSSALIHPAGRPQAQHSSLSLTAWKMQPHGQTIRSLSGAGGFS
jgi:hypothetical protein